MSRITLSVIHGLKSEFTINLFTEYIIYILPRNCTCASSLLTWPAVYHYLHHFLKSPSIISWQYLSWWCWSDGQALHIHVSLWGKVAGHVQDLCSRVLSLFVDMWLTRMWEKKPQASNKTTRARGRFEPPTLKSRSATCSYRHPALTCKTIWTSKRSNCEQEKLFFWNYWWVLLK